MKTKKRKSRRIVDESFDSSWLTPEEREEGARLTGEYIKKLKAGWTEEEHLKSRMLSLKYLIKNYLNSNQYDSEKGFAFFLKEYIQRQNKKNSEFAKEISISAVELSQLVNSHRDPNLKIIVRLAAHSNQNFPAIMWFNLYSKDKTVELLENKKLQQSEKKYVKKGLGFSF
jgi:plasmid maintenance system antidote protein VapI